jgi:hypothetical protein
VKLDNAGPKGLRVNVIHRFATIMSSLQNSNEVYRIETLPETSFFRASSSTNTNNSFLLRKALMAVQWRRQCELQIVVQTHLIIQQNLSAVGPALESEAYIIRKRTRFLETMDSFQKVSSCR